MKFNAFRYATATGQVNWLNERIFLAAVDAYTFDETHESLADIQTSGGVVKSMSPLANKELDVDGWAKSGPVTLPLVGAGTYDLVLLWQQGSSDFGTIAHYADAAVTALNGDLIVRPQGSEFVATGNWFRY